MSTYGCFTFRLRAFCTICSLILSIPSWSQTKITGHVRDRDGNGVPFANVLLLQARDSALVKGMVSSEAGAFELDHTQSGFYLVSASMVGHGKQYSAPFTVEADPGRLELPPLVLAEVVSQLGEVSVAAAKPLYEMQMDRLVVNVQNSITAVGATALEVLERSPGITVDRQNKALTMNGKSGVQVMINGKLSRLPLEAVVQMLEGMSADNIEKIELITTPPAHYDAEGNAGMINIVLKKNTDYGTNGSITGAFGYGRYEKPSASLNLNHRTPKLNMYGTYAFAYNHYWQQIVNTRQISHLDKVTSTRSHSDWPHLRIFHDLRTGFDYTLSPKTTLSGIFSGINNKAFMDGWTNMQIQEGEQVTKLIQLKSWEMNHWRQAMANLNLRHTFNKVQEVSLDLDYLKIFNSFPVRNDTHHRHLVSQETDHHLIRSSHLTPIHTWVAKADYAHSLNATTKLETGVKGTITRLGSRIELERNRQGGGWERDPVFSQELAMEEDIMAAYGNIYFQVNPKTKLQTGLRWEHTRTDLTNAGQERLVARRYGNLFPSLFLTQELNQHHNLQLSYSRRISRPSFGDLSPFLVFLDYYTVLSGNPSLRPTLTDAVQGTYQFKKVYLLSLQYSQANNVIDWLFRVDPLTNHQTIYRGNIDHTKTYSVSLSLPFTVCSWWQTQHNLLGVSQELTSRLEGADVRIGNQYGRFNATHTFTLPHQLSLELSGFYQTPALFGLARMKSQGALNVGVQKKLEKERGTLSLSVSDVFWTSRIYTRSYVPAANLDVDLDILFDTRVVKLTYSRNFGNKNVKAAKQRKTGSEEERSRVSGG